MLALALIHVELYGVAVGAVEGFVAIEDDLDKIVARRDVMEVADRIAVRAVIDNAGLAGLELVHVETEYYLRFWGQADLHAGFGGGVV